MWKLQNALLQSRITSNLYAKHIKLLSFNRAGIHQLTGISNNYKTIPYRATAIVNNVNVSTFIRNFSSDRHFPRLSDSDLITKPDLFHTLHNWILLFFVIRQQLDYDFNFRNFIKITKMVIENVSERLSNGDFDKLEGLIEHDTLESVKEKISKDFTLSERQQLSVRAEDMYFSFIPRVTVENSDDNKRVEVIVTHYVFRGNTERLKSAAQSFQFLSPDEVKSSDDVFILNYTLSREYYDNDASNWIIDDLNHVRLKDMRS